MAIQTAANTPQYSGNRVPNAVWSGKILVKFYARTCVADICNTDYEGEISKMGDRLVIRTTPNINVFDVEKHKAYPRQIPDSDPNELVIDRAKGFCFEVDDINKFQSDLDFVEDFSRDAAEQFKISTDTTVLGSVYQDADAANQGSAAGKTSGNIDLGDTGAPFVLDKTKIIDYIVSMGQCLDEQNVPEDDRALVIPPWMCAMIKTSDLKSASITGDDRSILRDPNGRLGMIDRFTVYSSNLLARTTDGSHKVTNIIACQKYALSFAAQFTHYEDLRNPDYPGDLVRGTMVYGFKVLKPEALVWGYVTPA